MRKFYLFICLSLSNAQSVFGHMSIAYFTNPPENSIAIIQKEDPSFFLEGMLLVALRPRDSQSMPSVPTAKLRIVKVFKDRLYAHVENDGSLESSEAFPDYPKVMAGDEVKIERKSVVANRQASEVVTLSYFDLFAHPEAKSTNFEFSSKGLHELKEIYLSFKDKRFSLLLIKAYTDHNGSSEDNQIESYQRALAIKSYLVEHYNFDPKKLVPLGLGEDDPKDASLAYGYERNNRRVIFSTTSTDG